MTFTAFDPKDPDATKAYTWDFSKWLDTGETIASFDFPDFPAALTKVSDSNTSTDVTALISGGLEDASYNITCRIVTTGGQTEDLTATLPVSST